MIGGLSRIATIFRMGIDFSDMATTGEFEEILEEEIVEELLDDPNIWEESDPTRFVPGSKDRANSDVLESEYTLCYGDDQLICIDFAEKNIILAGVTTWSVHSMLPAEFYDSDEKFLGILEGISFVLQGEFVSFSSTGFCSYDSDLGNIRTLYLGEDRFKMDSSRAEEFEVFELEQPSGIYGNDLGQLDVIFKYGVFENIPKYIYVFEKGAIIIVKSLKNGWDSDVSSFYFQPLVCEEHWQDFIERKLDVDDLDVYKVNKDLSSELVSSII